MGAQQDTSSCLVFLGPEITTPNMQALFAPCVWGILTSPKHDFVTGLGLAGLCLNHIIKTQSFRQWHLRVWEGAFSVEDSPVGEVDVSYVLTEGFLWLQWVFVVVCLFLMSRQGFSV